MNDDDIAQDNHGHGTFLAGIAAALTDNHTGIAGTSWYGQILAVKVLDSSGSGTHADVADGMVFATDNGADLINLSLGSSSPSTTLENAVRYAFDRGVVLVAAVGNDNGPVLYPAAYDDFVLGVTATYATASGTSASAPYATGLAALLLSQTPTLTPDQVMNQIKTSSQDVKQATLPGEDDHLGSGRINAHNALTLALVHPAINSPGVLAGGRPTFWVNVTPYLDLKGITLPEILATLTDLFA